MALKEFVKSAGPRQDPKYGPPRIELLYVEDENLNWEVTELHLRERYKLTRAVSSQDAFEKLAQKTFHVVLMDIQLANSDLNGIEITQVIRGTFKGTRPAYAQTFSPSDVPIIFMTAYSANYSKADLLERGGDDLIYKPVDFTHLSIAISKALMKPLRKRAPA